jgi:nicotinate-nucleotide adenylyltransferase
VFNPPHIGHLICAQEARAELGLDTVLLVPVGEAPHRQVEADPGGEVRFALCEAATRGDERLEPSRLELDRPGPSYTADTLDELAAQRPGAELVLILGGDEAAALPSWHAPERVLASATVAAVEREERGREEVRAAVRELAGGERVEFFAMPRLDVSSTLVRGRVAEGRPIRYLVPDAVAELIAARGLYGGEAGRPPRGPAPGTIAGTAGVS